MESMKHQINLLSQLQELILTRDEHHQTGDGSHLDSLNDSIDALVDKLEPQPKTLIRSTTQSTRLWTSWSRSPRRSTSASTRKTIS